MSPHPNLPPLSRGKVAHEPQLSVASTTAWFTAEDSWG